MVDTNTKHSTWILFDLINSTCLNSSHFPGSATITFQYDPNDYETNNPILTVKTAESSSCENMFYKVDTQPSGFNCSKDDVLLPCRVIPNPQDVSVCQLDCKCQSECLIRMLVHHEIRPDVSWGICDIWVEEK